MLPSLSPAQCLLLADSLPDSPETVISLSQLRRGLARAWVNGSEVTEWETAVIEDIAQPGEPLAFSQNPVQLADLLQSIPNWDCVNVTPQMAGLLAPLLETRLGCPVRFWGDVYHTLTIPAPQLENAHVRLLTPADLSLLEAAPFELQGLHPRRTLLEMAIAGAVVDGRLVAVAQNHARSAHYGEIGVHTLPEWRGRGFATAAATLIAQHVQSVHLIPVWSCGEGNEASLRVAHKLGFSEVSRRVYLILDRGIR